ncbi:MAG: hypothetical protein QM703_20990 [Gemmatales bacterium]
MKTEDPLERAFEFIKADSTEAAINPNLENRLMIELQKQNRPSRWKRAAWMLAALMAVVLAGGGIAAAAGYNPLDFFRFTDGQGNPIDFQVQSAVQNADGSTTITGTVSNANGGTQTVHVDRVPLGGAKK